MAHDIGFIKWLIQTARARFPKWSDDPTEVKSMDILRGVWTAYLWAVAILATLFLPGVIIEPPSYFGIVFFIAIVGAMFMLPAAFVALTLFYVLRAVLSRVRWWLAPLSCTLLLGLLFATLNQSLLGAVWGLILGPIAGYAFWRGAVGHFKSAHLRAGMA